MLSWQTSDERSVLPNLGVSMGAAVCFFSGSAADKEDKGLAGVIHITGLSARVQRVAPWGSGCARCSVHLDDKGRNKTSRSRLMLFYFWSSVVRGNGSMSYTIIVSVQCSKPYR